jgi:hypothetical protein
VSTDLDSGAYVRLEDSSTDVSYGLYGPWAVLMVDVGFLIYQSPF